MKKKPFSGVSSQLSRELYNFLFIDNKRESIGESHSTWQALLCFYTCELRWEKYAVECIAKVAVIVRLSDIPIIGTLFDSVFSTNVEFDPGTNFEGVMLYTSIVPTTSCKNVESIFSLLV